MISYRPRKSSSASSSLPQSRSSTSNNNGNSAVAVLGGASLISSSSTFVRSKPSSLLIVFQVAILIIGGIFLIWEQPEDYIARMDPKDRNKAAICAIQKGGLRYLDEWTQYHLLAIGFENIYLYDNSEDFELQAWHDALDDDPNNNNLKERIQIRHFPGPKRQNQAFSHCARQIQWYRSHGWIAFIDIDEFVVLRNLTNHPYISDLLQSLPADYGGLAMNWVSIQLNNQTHYQDLPVTLRFQNRSEGAGINRHIKTIARSEYLRRVSNPHFVDYLWSRPSIRTYDTKGNEVVGPFNPAMADDEIALYHYQTKSLEEYKERCSRGRADVPKKEWSDQMACKSDEEIVRNLGKPERIKDDTPWQLLKERVPQYANKYIAT